MPSILFVSKPVVPPWNDSGKNLVRDLATHLTRHRAVVMVRADQPCQLPDVQSRPVYADAGGFAPALKDQARVFGHLLGSRGHAAWHFFFAPNPRSCLAGRLASRARRMRTVHTLSSAPKDARAIVPVLFADVNVVLSRHTEAQLTEAGLAADRIVRIAPAIAPLTPLTPAQAAHARRELGLPAQEPLVVYPGDLEFGHGAQLMVEAFGSAALRGAHLVMACRAKTDAARAAERVLRTRADALGIAARLHWVGETPSIHALLGCAELVALPSTDLYAKMDYPLVLLEAMSLARPVLVAQGTPASELCEGGAALAVEPRSDALAARLAQLLDSNGQRSSLGQNGRASVFEHYTAQVMAQRYESVYDALLG